MSILIRRVLLNGELTDIAVSGNIIEKTEPGIIGDFDTVIDGHRKAAFPPFYNTHCHGAMTLLRGMADDMNLWDWLNNHIWPAEARLTADDIYWGTRLACLEMIKSGTVFFSDMYFMPSETVRAAEDAGLRASVGMVTVDSNPDVFAALQKANREIWEARSSFSGRIQLALAPHAIYTVSEKTLRQISGQAAELDIPVHIHLAETVKEAEECMTLHGCTPAEYLDRIGLLSGKTLAAHSIHLTDSDIALMSERQVNLAYIPCSNYKLCSGRFRFRSAAEAGCRITLGTDGCASNNSLSMFDEMKMGAFNAKNECGDPAGCTARQIFHAATAAGAAAFGIDAGVIAPGHLADIMLIDLDSPMMTADYNLISNLVYSADSSCVSDLICDGRVLMQSRTVPGESEIISQCRRCIAKLKK